MSTEINQEENIDYEVDKDADKDDNPVAEEMPAERVDTASGDEPAPPAASTEATPGTTPAVDPATLPSHWCEVFIGNIAKTATEQDVRAVCEPLGPVHSLQLIADPANPGQNKGFGFVRFTSKKTAAVALETLSGKDLGAYPGRRLRVSPSQSKHKVYLGNIPRDVGRDALMEQLQQATPGLESIEMSHDKDNPGQNRGFCFLDYKNQQCAIAAMRTLKEFRLQNRTLNASFSDRAADDVSNRVDIKSVYVGNLPSGADEEGLRELFNGLGQGQVTKVIIPQPRPGKEFSEYGFVHFESHSAAVGVWEVSETQELTLKGNKLTINLAKASSNRQPGDRSTQQYDRAPQQQYGGPRGRPAPAAGAAGGAYGVYGGAVAAAGAVGLGGVGTVGAVGAGSILVPTMLPNGQMAYVLTPTAGAAPGGGYDQGGRGGPVRRGDGGRGGRGPGGDRYRPY